MKPTVGVLPDRLTPAREHIDLRVGGMTCAHCQASVEKALLAVPGVLSAHVNFANEVVRIEYDEAQAKIGEMVRAVRALGYCAGSAKAHFDVKNIIAVHASRASSWR